MTELYKPMIKLENPKNLEEIARELLEERVLHTNKSAGLVFGNNRSISMYDFESKKVETVAKELGGGVYSIDFFKDTLWFGLGHEKNIIGNIKSEDYFKRDSWVKCLFNYKGALFDCSEDGVIETLCAKPHITKEDLKEKDIQKIDAVFYHRKKLLLLGRRNNNSIVLYNLNTAGKKISFGNVYPLYLESCPNMTDATSAYGNIITTNNLRRLSINGISEFSTEINRDESYHRVLFDESRNLVYASGYGINKIKTFKVIKNTWLLPEKDLVSEEGSIYALLLVTQEEMEVIREQSK